GEAIIGHGFDQFMTGMKTALTGQHHLTATEQLLQKTGMSSNAASLTNDIISTCNPIGAAALIRNSELAVARAFRLRSMENQIIENLEIFLGKDSRLFKNIHGDLVIESKDGLRQFRMDLNHTSPHKNPHSHLIEYQLKKNKKYEIINERIYPIDVKPE
ncbi:MAG: hypothetical protein KGJ02_06905, partial [Verrucomicrobiota bacterium]|nr:hypothetical protein [Verrucomicrobiota bacterium]